MVPGKKMFGIFSSCQIDKFVDITHCLQEDVLLFVNEIGAFIHSIASALGGYASKCDGESFLLVWKISSNLKEVPFIEASPAPEHLKSKEQVVDYFQVGKAPHSYLCAPHCHSYRFAPHCAPQNMVANQVENTSNTPDGGTKENEEPHLADSALLSALAILSQLRRLPMLLLLCLSSSSLMQNCFISMHIYIYVYPS